MTDKMIDAEAGSVRKALKGLALNFCIAFTLFTLLSCCFGLIFADEAARPGIIMCLTLGVALFMAAALQCLFFTPVLIKSMGYVARLVLFGISLYVLLALCGALFQWFPPDEAGAWASFTVIYLIIFALMTFLFTLMYRRSIKRLNEGLARYRSANQ